MFWLMRLVHMGIQRAIVTNKKQKKKKKEKKIKNPTTELSNDPVSDVRSSHLFFSFLHCFFFFFKEHPRGLTLSRFSVSRPSTLCDRPSLCDSEPAGFTDRKSLQHFISLFFKSAAVILIWVSVLRLTAKC